MSCVGQLWTTPTGFVYQLGSLAMPRYASCTSRVCVKLCSIVLLLRIWRRINNGLCILKEILSTYLWLSNLQLANCKLGLRGDSTNAITSKWGTVFQNEATIRYGHHCNNWSQQLIRVMARIGTNHWYTTYVTKNVLCSRCIVQFVSNLSGWDIGLACNAYIQHLVHPFQGAVQTVQT